MSGYPNQPPQAWNNISAPGQQQYPPQPGQYPAPGQPYAPPGQYVPPGQFPPPGQYNPGQYAPGQGYPPQAGFSYPYPGPGSQPAIVPTATAPSYSYPMGYAPPQTTPISQVEWVPTTPQQAVGLSDRAVVGGYEGYDGSPLWVIRARHEGDLIPGKLAIKHQAAYVAWGGNENEVRQIEVCCARPDKIRWQESRDGVIPPNAIAAGNTTSGEPLYVGRAREQGSLTPGKVQPSHRVMYISFAGKEVAHKVYEILCYV